MKLVSFHLMPYRPLDLAEAAKQPLALGGIAETTSTTRSRVPRNTRATSTPSSMPRSSALMRSASTSITRPLTA